MTLKLIVIIFISIICAILIITSTPITALFYLILLFINGSLIIILLGLNYIGFTIIIVYAVAIALLFAFVIMMMELNFPTNLSSVYQDSNKIKSISSNNTIHKIQKYFTEF
jgi:NADH:ubiquinone oxidoreductase subunit 6 (subunit J)